MTIGMLEAGREASLILKHVLMLSTVGRSLNELDDMVGDAMKRRGCTSAPIELGFPSYACYSVNDVCLHGVATDYVLKKGDILSVDVSLNCEGFYGDNCATIEVGVENTTNKLILAAKKLRDVGIEQAIIGNTPADIGKAIQDKAKELKVYVLKNYGGHGIGDRLHKTPFIPSYNNGDTEWIFKEGDFITVEPVVLESKDEVEILEDKWTVRTIKGSRAAQFEHTIEITKEGPKILTDLLE